MRKQTVGERHILSGVCLMAHATNMVVPSTEVMDKAEEAGLGSETGSWKAVCIQGTTGRAKWKSTDLESRENNLG